MIRTFAAHTNESTIKCPLTFAGVWHTISHTDSWITFALSLAKTRVKQEIKRAKKPRNISGGSKVIGISFGLYLRLQGAAMPCVYLFVFACYYPEMESYTLTLTAGPVIEQSGDRRADSYSQK